MCGLQVMHIFPRGDPNARIFGQSKCEGQGKNKEQEKGSGCKCRKDKEYIKVVRII
jgi:hypothetical protein